MSAALNIAALSRRTGVASDTLRKWEQRYKILEPVRTSGGQRRYSERDVQRVEWLKARLAEGYRIGEAATLLGRRSEPVARSPVEHREAIVDAVAEDDVSRVGILLDQAFALRNMEEVLVEIVEPVLVEIGERWERGELSVAQEHLATEAIRGRLAHLLADTRGGVRGVVVLACVPGERHDVGLLMLAIMLRSDGWQVVYLGADTPLAAAADVAHKLQAEVLGVSVAMEERLADIEQIEVPRGTRLVIGGRGASAAAAKQLGARYVDANLRRSVEAIRKLSA